MKKSKAVINPEIAKRAISVAVAKFCFLSTLPLEQDVSVSAGSFSWKDPHNADEIFGKIRLLNGSDGADFGITITRALIGGRQLNPNCEISIFRTALC